MKITSEIKDHEFSVESYRNGRGLVSNYFFIAGHAVCTLTIDNVDHDFTLQTGAGLHHGNYNLPTNQVDTDYDFIESLLEEYPHLSAFEEDIREQFNDLCGDVRHIVQCVEDEAEEKLNNIDKFFIRSYEVDEHDRQCSPYYVLAFDNEDDQEYWVKSYTTAIKISADEACLIASDQRTLFEFLGGK